LFSARVLFSVSRYKRQVILSSLKYNMSKGIKQYIKTLSSSTSLKDIDVSLSAAGSIGFCELAMAGVVGAGTEMALGSEKGVSETA